MDALSELERDLFVADRPLPLVVGDIGTRMTVIRLADGGLFLHSPVHLDEATRAALDALGPVRAVVAPNKLHHFFVGDYIRAYPDARVYAAPGLEKKRKDLSFHGVIDDDAPGEWAGQIEQHLFRGAPGMNEIVFFHAKTKTLLLTDFAFNVPAGATEKARLFYWLVGAAGRFGPHRFCRAFIRDRRAAKASLERVLGWEFERVTVTHGEVLERGGPEKLREGFAFL
jgi:Domain of unknown function (DUF4336)